MADHEIGASTVMLPASAPALPAAPVEITTLALASRVSSVVTLMFDVAFGVQTAAGERPAGIRRGRDIDIVGVEQQRSGRRLPARAR